MFKTCPEGVALIKEFEGLRLDCYRCPKGIPTIGWGHTASCYPGQRITESYAEQLLAFDLARFEAGVTKLLGGIELNTYQFSALVSFAFNLGLGALQKSTLLKRIKGGRFDDVPAEFRRWNKMTLDDGRVVTVPGLTRRRAAEARLWNNADATV